MIRLHSSLRTVPPEQTLAYASALAGRLGISRVTDVTRLDTIGIPVYSAVRPTAIDGSLCVNAGKGVRRIDARVGAYMESIEFALAEPGAAPVEPRLETARAVLDGATRPDAILDFCPIARRGFDLAAPLACVEAEEIVGGGRVRVPAELVLLPYVGHPGTGSFGSSSNGLASGNTRDEATLHALLELIERDGRSFHAVVDRSQRVRSETLPSPVREQVRKVEAAGYEICLRTHPNEFEIPCFQAILRDPGATNSLVLSAGYGCHLVAEIAVVRAITEAVQSRLSWIHGARDDLAEADAEIGDAIPPEVARRVAAQFARYATDPNAVDFREIRDWTAEARSIESALSFTIEQLLRHGIRHVCRIAFTEPAAPLQVVRILVPRLEYLDRFSHRIGPRLHAFIRNRG